MIRNKIATGTLALALAFCAISTFSQAAKEVVIPVVDKPVRLTAPEGDPRLFVAGQTGLVRVFDRQGVDLGTFLDLRTQIATDGERGLLGLAFAPDYVSSGRFYVSFTDLQGDLNIARYLVDDTDPNLAIPLSQEVILTVDVPTHEHIAGHIEFGPDGFLYIAIGDGEFGGDPGNRAQDTQSLLGKILRLDVSGSTGYTVPPDNPFVGLAPRDEIWALGLRNPWCFSFDRLTGDLYIADVGENTFEEINIQPASSSGGENYGWRLMEGTNCFDPSFGCEPDTLTMPAHLYSRGGNPWRCAISGGYVYRGQAVPSLQGQYFFADYCSRQIWSLSWTESGGLGAVVERTDEMLPDGGILTVASFGQDGLGELYILDHGGGFVSRIVSATSAVPEIPSGLILAQNIPNPFNPQTEIAFSVNPSREPTTLVVYDAAGRRVRDLVSGVLAAGDHTVTWDGTDDHGNQVPSGLYIYQLRSGGSLTSRKMLLLE